MSRVLLRFGPLAPLLDAKVAELGRAAQFRFYAALLLSGHYVLGRENLLQTDCSGTICWALFCLGYEIRMVARDLFVHLFPGAGDLSAWEEDVLALFYRRPDGLISHVSPVIGRGAILDAWAADEPVEIKAALPVMQWYIDHGYQPYIRRLDWQRAEEASGQWPWEREADDVLKELRQCANPT